MLRYVFAATGLAALMIFAGCGDVTTGPDATGDTEIVDLDAATADAADTGDTGDAAVMADATDTAGQDGITPIAFRMSPAMAYHEHTIGDLAEGVHLNQDDTVALWLEHPVNGLASTLDTGVGLGVDEIEVEYFIEHDHTFCWNDVPDDDPHSMTLLDPDGNEVFSLDEGGGCRTVKLDAGVYTQVFSHGGGGTEGELLFLKPVMSQETPAAQYARDVEGVLHRSSGTRSSGTRASGTPCVATRTITAGTISQLASGEIGLLDTCAPTSNTTVWVFDQSCANLLGTTGNPGIDVMAMYAGPDTGAVIYSASNYARYSFAAMYAGPDTGAVVYSASNYARYSFAAINPDPNKVASSSGSGPMCLDGWVFRNDFQGDMKRSFKVWENLATSSAAVCKVEWLGPASLLPASGPLPGEAWLYTEKNLTGIAFRLSGPCHDLCNVTGSQVISSAWIGADTVMTIYADPDYLGSMFAFQHVQADLYQYDNMARSVYVESLGTYNNETTLISKNNCDSCNLIGMRLIDGENLANASLADANLTNARMVGVNLSNANAPRAIFRGANLAYANLKGATLSNAVFEGDDHTKAADLSYAYMPNVRLDHAHLNYVTADYAQIYGTDATVLQATMVGIHMANAILCNMDFSQASMKGATLTGANLISAIFRGADLTQADLVNASIQGTVFDGAFLYGAKLQNSTFAFEPGSLMITRLGDNDTQVVASVSFNATSMPPDTTNADTFCPYGGQSDDGNAWCDSVTELTAPNPPAPPACIPSPTQFCPRTPK